MTERLFQAARRAEKNRLATNSREPTPGSDSKKGIDRDFYVTLMTQVFHYTRFQCAEPGARRGGAHIRSALAPSSTVFITAYTEAGHDLMVLKDLETIGVSAESVRASRPLPETAAFIGYLFRLRERDATARLGYSYWAEGCYPYLEDFLVGLRRDLKLAPSQLSFLVAHSVIDKAHLEEVKDILRESCAQDRALQDGVVDVLETSLHLMKNIFTGRHYGARATCPLA